MTEGSPPKIDPKMIEVIKNDSNLLVEVEKRGILLQPKGKEYTGLCPFHQEKTPSFNVTADGKKWKCFGCGEGGDVFKFVMKIDKLDFMEAACQLSNMTLADFKDGRPPQRKLVLPKEEIARKAIAILPDPPEPPRSLEAEQTILQVLAYYTKTLKNTPTVLAYLKKRGLTHPDLIDHFKIGYCDRSLNKLLAKDDKPSREVLKKIGILAEGREIMNGRLTFPIFTPENKLGEIYGRRVSKNRSESLNHRYLPNAHEGMFNGAAFRQNSPLILCESVIDALSFWVHGWTHVTASFGADCLTEEMEKTIVTKGIEEVWIAYDNDEAGNLHAGNHASRLMKHGVKVERISLPKNKDINEIITDSNDPKEALGHLLEQRRAYNPSPKIVQAKTLNPPTKNEVKPPPLAEPSSTLQASDTGVLINFGPRYYCLRGLESITSLRRLKIQIRLQVARGPGEERIFIDTVDLTLNRSRKDFINGAGEETKIEADILKKDLGKILLEVEGYVSHRLANESKKDSKQAPPMEAGDRAEALKFLQSKDLFDQILKDFEIIGMVGEEENKLVGYLAAVSRKLEDPLAILVQSSSSAGKTALMDSILELVPPEEQIKWTATSGQALYYVEEDLLKHKILAVSEEEGIEKANYSLKNLISDKKLTLAVTIKDPKSGDFKTQEKDVSGPAAIILTTTAAVVDEELINRFLRLTIDENKEQTRRIHQKQRHAKTLEGWKAQTLKDQIKKKHHNAQRLLRPLRVFNPYAEQLEFTVDYLRNRRDNQKYLGLIEVVAYLRQYQKKTFVAEKNGVTEESINVEIKDIQVTNTLIHQVLGRCLDELAPQTRRLLKLLFEMVRAIIKKEEADLSQEQIRFTRKTVRAYTHWSDGQLQIHLKRLEELEYLETHQGGRGQHFVYTLLWKGEGKDGSFFIIGLKDPKDLK